MLRVEIFRAQTLQNALVAATTAAQGNDNTSTTNNKAPMTTMVVEVAPSTLSLYSNFGSTMDDTSHGADATRTNETTNNKTTTTTIYADEAHHINLWTAYQDYKSGHVWQKKKEDDDNSSHNIILGIGRKNAMITFEEDKSVSRTHAQVKLIVNPTKLKSLQPPIGSSDDGAGNNEITQEDIDQIQPMFGPQNEMEQVMFQRKSEEEADPHDNADNVHDEKSSLSHQNGFVLAIEDIGSKFGTFLLEPLVFDASTASSTTSAKPTSNHQNEDDDETTDDEQVNNHTAPVGTQPSSLHQRQPGGSVVVVPTSSMYVTDAGIPHTPTPQAISSAEMLSKLFFQDSTTANKNSVVETTSSSSPLYYKQTQLTPKNSSPLYIPLWNNNDNNEQTFVSSNKPKSVLLQLGVYGSCIRFTHIPLVMCASALSKDETTTTIPRLLQFGLGTCVFHPTTWNNSTNTHLITNEVRPTGKNLAAWLLDKSIVKPMYIQRLMIDRSSCKQSLPTLSEYEAPLSESGSKGGMVRHLSIQDRQQKRSKLTNAIVIGTHPKEHAELLSLCDAMGAFAIVPAYDFIDDILETQQGKNDEWLYEFLKTPSKKVSNEEQQHYDDRRMILALEVMTKKHSKKLKSLLKVVSAIKSVRFVKCASIGEYVVKSDGNLVDTNGQDITEQVRNVRNEKEDDTTSKEATSKIKNEASPATNDHKVKEKSPDQLEEENDILDVGGGGGDEAEDFNNDISIADKDAQGGGSEGADVENVPSSASHTTRKKRLAVTSSEESKHNDNGVSSKVSNKKRKVRLNDEPQPIKKERTKHNHGDERGQERKSLLTTNDGWMVAAPSDRRQRQAYKRRLEDMDMDDATLFRRHGDAILTETMPQPEMVRQHTSKNHKNKSVNQKFTSKKRGGGPNFKAFKKNFIPLATEDTSNITFDIVLPKETERQRQLLLTQKELERQEQQADALFQAVPSGASQKAGGRRRRTGR